MVVAQQICDEIENVSASIKRPSSLVPYNSFLLSISLTIIGSFPHR